MYYASPLLERVGVPHAFSTRIGGVSDAPFASLNLGNPNGCAIQDPQEHLAENYRRIQEAAGCGGRPLWRLYQEHAGKVIVVKAGQSLDPNTKADALVGNDPSAALQVRIADCVPVLVSAEDGSAVAAIHAGWRGVIADVVPAAIAALCKLNGITPGQCLAAIGPCIGPAAFEVGPEVLAAFTTRFGVDAPITRRADGKGTVDLQLAVRRQLREAGLADARIDGNNLCTFRDVDEFYSHRRDNGITGRMAAVIGPKADAPGAPGA